MLTGAYLLADLPVRSIAAIEVSRGLLGSAFAFGLSARALGVGVEPVRWPVLVLRQTQLGADGI